MAMSACTTDQYGNSRPMTDTERGALIGAGVGALLGIATSSNKKKGAVLGAVGGAIAGGLVGYYMDSQQKDLEKQLQTELDNGSIRLEKQPKHSLRISMTSATAFDVNSQSIKTGFYSTMNKIAKVLNKYGKTELMIVGHTDSTGSAAFNQTLSEKRANAVNRYLLQQKVISQRLSTFGKGEQHPIATNDTTEGRRKNRRVEIYVVPLVENNA